MSGTYNIWIVALSIAVAAFASYTALDLAGRVTAARGRARKVWLAGGALAMGIGIWSMHFIGMLAYSVPIPMTYDVPTVLASMLVAIVASGVALFVVSRRAMSTLQLLIGGVFMGLGITSMHYVGMAGMRMQAAPHYDLMLVGLSIVIAIGASLTALWLAFELREDPTSVGTRRKVGGALIMGGAISGMHYTAMAAFSFMPTEELAMSTSGRVDVNTSLLTAGVGVASLVILGLALLSSLVDRRFSKQAFAFAEALRREAIFQAVRFGAERFLSTPSWEEDIDAILNELGQAMGADRAYVFMTSIGKDGTVAISQQYEWTAQGVASEIDNPKTRGLSLQAAGFARWQEALSQGRLIYGRGRDFSKSEQDALSEQGIRSIAVAPVFAGQNWWGNVRFDRCLTERAWSAMEVEALKTAASTMGNAVQRQQVEQALRQSEEKLRFQKTLLEAQSEASIEGILVVSTDSKIISFNRRFQELWEIPGEVMATRSDDAALQAVLNKLVEPQEFLARVAYLYEHQDEESREEISLKDGRTFDRYSAPVKSADNVYYGRVWYFRDITERKVLEEQLTHQAFHDSLTGLPNRALFLDRLEHTLARQKRRKGKVAMLFIDLDNFKFVNDSLGHKVGDQLLVAVPERLQDCLRPEDTIARLSGDEFTVLLEDVASPNDATHVAERIVEQLQAPFMFEGHQVYITASIGIVLSTPFAKEPPEELLRKADIALYLAKNTGKANFKVFIPSMDAMYAERLNLEGDLRRAVEREEFTVYYQPNVSLEPNQIIGVEALVRWKHPERGLIYPKKFVPLAEETGLIVPLGQQVLREACRQTKEWQERYPSAPPLMIYVNLSGKQLQCPEVVPDVAEALGKSGLEPGTLCLEITESVLMEDAPSSFDTLWRLKDLGVKLAIDDFGTGYSSLSYLKRLPVDFLKIDRSFVAGLGERPEDRGIAQAVVDLSHTLGLKVVAEGVETEKQLAHLRGIGCELAQGYCFWKPLPSAATGELLADKYVDSYNHSSTPLTN
jgi:diguanylate cyclase (GGDEF)-like protein